MVTQIFGPDLTLEQAIQQAVGAASMCWATPEGAGLFQEDRARAIAADLLDGLREGRWTETPVAQIPTGRPSTIAEHLDEAERLLAFAFIDNDPEEAPGGYYVDDDHCNAQVRAAEVHARIAHAAAAAGMLRPLPSEPEEPAGLAALQSLAASVERLAAAVEAEAQR